MHVGYKNPLTLNFSPSRISVLHLIPNLYPGCHRKRNKETNSIDMALHNTISPEANTNPTSRERRIVPANTYYIIPYLQYIIVLYGTMGAFSCAWISDFVSSVTTAVLWILFTISYLLLILMLPCTYAERKKIDENGHVVTLRCPLIGFKMFEVDLDLEGIDKGLYDPEDGRADPRLRDGYRYGPALIRI